jgi:heat-inducible transcriptional repressor
MITELNERSKTIFRYLVETYLDSGTAIGSKTISSMPGLDLSPATIRNVMAELEAKGLLFAPHTSSGRLPTQTGLRLYVDGLMEIGNLSNEERHQIKAICETNGQSMSQMMQRASTLLSGLSSGLGLVYAPKADKPLHNVQFVHLDDTRILVILVSKDGMVENRVIEFSCGESDSALEIASNYLNHHLNGKTLNEMKDDILEEIKDNRSQLDDISARLIEKGLAISTESTFEGHLIIRGQSKLLEDLQALEDIEHARMLFEALEEQDTLVKLLDATHSANGVEIFIGTENTVFENSGWSLVLSPYKTESSKIVGAIGVIGPTRINYGRIIPLVDYTSKVMSKLLVSE